MNHMWKNVDTVCALADSDFVGDRKSRKSVGKTRIFFESVVIVCKTIFQQTIAFSLLEANFYALSEAGKLVLYIIYVLEDLQMYQ